MFKPASDVPPPPELTPQEQEKWQQPMRVMDKIGLMKQIVQQRANPAPPASPVQAPTQEYRVGAPAFNPQGRKIMSKPVSVEPVNDMVGPGFAGTMTGAPSSGTLASTPAGKTPGIFRDISELMPSAPKPFMPTVRDPLPSMPEPPPGPLSPLALHQDGVPTTGLGPTAPVKTPNPLFQRQPDARMFYASNTLPSSRRSFNTMSQPALSSAQSLATRYQPPQPTMGAAPLIGGSAFRR